MPNTVEIVLDKPRKLRFRFRDIDELCRRLGGITVVQLVERATGGDTQFVLWGLFCGLRHEDSRLSTAKVQDIIENWLQKDDTSITEIISSLDKAISSSGIFGKQEENGGPPSGEVKPGSHPQR